MPDLVHRHNSGGVAILEISNPPANVVSAPVCAALTEALDAALADQSIGQIVIAAAGSDFSTGLDFAEPSAAKRKDAAGLSALCTRIEDASKPVIAAVQGQIMASGAELMLAAHYRIATASAVLAFPEIKVGLIPHAGATQRLPRLLGAAAALDVFLSGRKCPVGQPPVRPLFDAVVADDLRAATLRFCATLSETGAGPRPVAAATAGFRDPMAYMSAVMTRREALRDRPELAPHALVDCIEAAQLLPFDAGLAREEEAYRDLVGGDQAQALRMIYLAERRLAQASAKNAAALPREMRIAILGGGPFATQLVISALRHGLAVNWGTRDPARLRAGVAEVTQALRAEKARARISDAALSDILDRLTLGESHQMAQDISVAIVASRGQGAVPLPPGVPRFKAFPDPVEHVDLRFAPPIATQTFVEILVGPKAEPSEVAIAQALARRMGKLPLAVVTQGPSATGRMMNALQAAADALIDLGEDPYAIDAAVREMGWPRAPFEIRDVRGLIEFSGLKRAAGARNWSAVLMQSGRQGVASGRGFYLHRDNGMQSDPAVHALLDEMRAPAAKPRSRAEIGTLLLAVLANEGAHILSDRALARPFEIDIAMVRGQAFPRWRGGPMMAADLAGLFRLKQALDAVEHPDPRLFTPHPIWGELIKNGRHFSDLNG